LPLWAGVLGAAGNLVFTGTGDGYFKAFDAQNRRKSGIPDGTGIISTAYHLGKMDGEGNISVLTTALRRAVPLWGAQMAELTKPVAPGRFVSGYLTT